MNLWMLLKSFFRRIVKDFRHKELIPIKIVFFVKASTLFVLYPYLTIHMRELGLNIEETALMSAVTPLAVIFMPPAAGLIADRIGNFRVSLAILTSIGGLAALLLLLVPVGRVNLEYPERVILDVSCSGSSGNLMYEMSQNYPCDTDLKSEVNMRIESCGFSCSIPTDNEVETFLNERAYTVKVSENDSVMFANYSISKRKLDDNVINSEDVRSHRMLENDGFYKTSIRQITNHTFFFPTDDLYTFNCNQVIEDQGGDLGTNILKCGFGNVSNKEKSRINQSFSYRPFKTRLEALNESEDDILMEMRRYIVRKSSWAGNDLINVKCNNFENADQSILITIGNYSSMNCSSTCLLTAPRREMCSNLKKEVVYNIQLTFWLYFIIRVFIGMIGSTAFAMFEGAVIAILREQKADYGLQRVYGSIGGMISSPLSGLMIDYFSRGKTYTEFKPAFYLYAILKFASGFLMLFLNLEFKPPAPNIIRDVFDVLKNIEIVTLYLVTFVLGTAWGYIESFLFWFLQDLGASQSLMGFTITVSGLAGLPLLVVSGPIISKLGHANVLFIGFIFYAIRLVGYSLIYDPWLCLICEALESVTSGLAFTAAVTYAARLSTTTTDGSVQGLLGGIYYGVGKGCGSLIGGFLMKAVGTRTTFQIFAVASLLTGMIYYVFNVVYLKKHPQVLNNDKIEPKKTKDHGDLENGSVEIDLGVKKQNLDKKETTQGYDNDAYSEDQIKVEKTKTTLQDIETCKNIKNLDNIEKIPESSHKKEENIQDKLDAGMKKNDITNLAFKDKSQDNDEYNATIKEEPEEEILNEFGEKLKNVP